MKIIKIGTRDSELALWQAHTVQNQLEYLGYSTELVPVKSDGDLNLKQPIYDLGITGVFTKSLDIALINGDIDIAVHSMKDVPTQLPKGMVQGAVMKRGLAHDVLVFSGSEDFFAEREAIIATGSLRRRAAWLNQYPTHTIVGLRGNINTRMQRLNDSDWNGAIFAAAGLKRIGLKGGRQVNLDWMVPAPAQGALMINVMENNTEVLEVVRQMNDEETALCTKIERDFLHTLEGGCSAPIGALAKVEEEGSIQFKGVLFSKDGQRKLEIAKTVKIEKASDLGIECAERLIDRGAKRIMREDELADAEIKIYSTKKLSESQKDLVHDGVGTGDSDFIKIRHNRLNLSKIPKHVPHVIFTSKNAVESLLQSLDSDKYTFDHIHCVGRRTKKLIESKLGKVTTVAPSAQALVDKLQDLKSEDIVYFKGNISLDIVSKGLSKTNNLQEIEVYKTLTSPVKVDEVFKAVLFYSPSGVQSFMELNTANTIAICIGETTASEARKHFDEVIVSKIPNVDAMIELANKEIKAKFLN
jgi:hydroxymethylbilane synthase